VWDGSAWTVTVTPLPAGAHFGYLSSVSCFASACVAGGRSSLRSMAEAWDGSAWSVQATPNPPGTHGAALEAMSCADAASCMAVGSAKTNGAGPTVPLAEAWNGAGWSIVATPKGVRDLTGVSCTAPDACIAIGGSSRGPVAERWDGDTWSLTATPQRGTLTGVSCVSAENCTAVGARPDPAGNGRTLAERWDGEAWTVEHTPNPPGRYRDSELAGVSCASGSACMAIGSMSFGRSGLLAEAWDGASWRMVHVQAPHDILFGSTTAVACAAADACTSVGSYITYRDNFGSRSLTEAWDGAAWSVVAAPSPTGDVGDALFDVSCV
jgi:hypothetical protein